MPGDGRRRWRRAGAYFAGCLAVAAATGVLDDLASAPDVTASWAALTALAFVVVGVGYGVVWPIGTFTLDRPRDLAVQVPFGVVWGGCQGLLFLSIWSLVDRLDLGRPATAALAFVAISTFQGLWHALYWDVRVAPEHNDPAWNLRKVLFCHVPNLAVSLTHLAVHRDPWVFVALQVLALTLSAVAMRFPRPAVIDRGVPAPRDALSHHS